MRTSQIVLRFPELEDFHPDRIYGRTEVFGALRDLRRQLDDPATFQATVRQMGIGAGIGPGPGPDGIDPGVGHPAPDASAPPPEDLLERILAETRGRDASPGPAEAGPWAAFWTGSRPPTGWRRPIPGRPNSWPASMRRPAS